MRPNLFIRVAHYTSEAFQTKTQSQRWHPTISPSSKEFKTMIQPKKSWHLYFGTIRLLRITLISYYHLLTSLKVSLGGSLYDCPAPSSRIKLASKPVIHSSVSLDDRQNVTKYTKTKGKLLSPYLTGE